LVRLQLPLLLLMLVLLLLALPQCCGLILLLLLPMATVALQLPAPQAMPSAEMFLRQFVQHPARQQAWLQAM
jgi:hypothetical protein